MKIIGFCAAHCFSSFAILFFFVPFFVLWLSLLLLLLPFALTVCLYIYLYFQFGVFQ